MCFTFSASPYNDYFVSICKNTHIKFFQNNIFDLLFYF